VRFMASMPNRSHWRRVRGIHTDRAFNQSCGPHAGPGADRFDRGDRRDPPALRRILSFQAADGEHIENS